jgi:molybdate-binding protein/transcriptional regulator with XRE-family HTH domain
MVMDLSERAGVRLRLLREARNWSQGELAARAGISRTGVSAIEGDRLVPSVTAALALARVLDVSVEEIFGEPLGAGGPTWAWPPRHFPSRYWLAEVNGRRLAFPGEPTACGEREHDGVALGSEGPFPGAGDPKTTLVMAGCDPAAGLLVSHFEREGRFRLLPLLRSSRQALHLLKEGLVHVAGVHLAPTDAPDRHRDILREELGAGWRLLRLAEWEEGVTVAPGAGQKSIRALLRSNVRWIGREPGSGARRCLDELFGKPRPLRRLAGDHRGVADAVRLGWGDAGICLRLAAEEAGLEFLSLQWESYDLCYRIELEDDPRLKTLVSVLRNPAFTRSIAALPGYDAKNSGTVSTVQ